MTGDAPPEPHRIHLRGFWDATPLPGGRTRHTRRFGRPRTVAAGETVWVTGTASAGPIAVLVNGVRAGEADGGAFAVDVTAVLQARNELAIESPTGVTPGDVAVEILFPPLPSVGEGAGG